MQVHHRLAHIDANLPRRHRQRIAHQRQAARRVSQLAGDQRHRRLRWIQQQRDQALGLHLCTPGNWPAARTNSGVKYTVSLALKDLELRTYRSAGSTRSSHTVTDSRKLATITVSATARLSEATTPLTATAADSRCRRARSTASSGKVCRATRGASRSSSTPISQGSAVIPPSSSKPTDT